jgi:signal transduction histidine kinase
MDQIPSQIYLIIFILNLVALIIIVFILTFKNSQVRQLKAAVIHLKKSFDELDEQAKLIVKTDLELNKAQEELDRRVNSLDALQKFSQLISTTLDENEILKRIDQSLIDELGFERNIVLVYDRNKKLTSRVAIGYSEEDVDALLIKIEDNQSLINTLMEGNILSSSSSTKQRKEFVHEVFNIEHFIIAPILTQNGLLGLLFVGNASSEYSVTEGDDELISILASQIGQSLENARLFEEVFRSTKNLEAKIQDRTKELADAFEEVKNISKTKTEFISAVSHELRTPLTSIKGYASLLMSGKLGEIPEQVKERLSKINTHSDNLVKLINDLLDIARIESGKVEMNMRKCGIIQMIENVHDLLTPQLRDKNIQWESTIEPQIHDIIADSSQIERVLINLVGNAIKFTPVNGLIKVTARTIGELVRVEVIDNGIGISAEDTKRLFDEFYRVENTINQNVKGTGLGLSLAKKIVEAHSGKMGVTSEINQGTTFYFTLPIFKQEPI